jgi:hypothetical protein
MDEVELKYQEGRKEAQLVKERMLIKLEGMNLKQLYSRRKEISRQGYYDKEERAFLLPTPELLGEYWAIEEVIKSKKEVKATERAEALKTAWEKPSKDISTGDASLVGSTGLLLPDRVQNAVFERANIETELPAEPRDGWARFANRPTGNGRIGF